MIDEQPVWVVTGASRGIGAAVATRAGRLGSRIALFARDGSHLAAVADLIVKSGGQALTVTGDARQPDDIERLFDIVGQKWGRVDCLVNSAGRGIYSPVADGRHEDWKAMVELNLLGVFYASQRAVKAMRKSGGGTIINISSVASRRGLAGWSVYNATKFGLNGFSEALRLETLHDRIRVVVIEPGAVDTEWGEDMPEELQRLRRSSRNLSAEDVADIVVYAATRPPHVALSEVLVRPTEQER